MDEEYAQGEAGAQSTTYTYTRGNSPAGLLDLPAVGLQKLSKLSVRECVKDTDAKGKEAGVQSLQHTIRNPDLAEAARCAPLGLR